RKAWPTWALIFKRIVGIRVNTNGNGSQNTIGNCFTKKRVLNFVGVISISVESIIEDKIFRVLQTNNFVGVVNWSDVELLKELFWKVNLSNMVDFTAYKGSFVCDCMAKMRGNMDVGSSSLIPAWEN